MSSGTESTEAALKLMRMQGKKNLKSKLKPGFHRQTKDFKKFLKTGKIQNENSIDFAKEIISFSERIFT